MLSLKPGPSFNRSKICRPTDSHTLLFPLLVYLEMSFFPGTVAVFSLYGEYVVHFSFRMVFLYLVTMGWIFDIIRICENSNKNEKKGQQSIRICQKQEQQTICLYKTFF